MPGALCDFNVPYCHRHDYSVLQRRLGYELVHSDSAAGSDSHPKLNLEKYALANKCMINDLQWRA